MDQPESFLTVFNITTSKCILKNEIKSLRREHGKGWRAAGAVRQGYGAEEIGDQQASRIAEFKCNRVKHY